MKLCNIHKEVIYENKKVNNMKELVELALKENVNLKGVDLSYAVLRDVNLYYAVLSYVNFTNANLTNADLRHANLSNVNLSHTNLTNANLKNANLTNADLRHANLKNANLKDANLYGTIGNRKEIKSMQIEKYNIAFTKDILQIGCECHTYMEWWNFTDKEILKMDGKEALLWWKKWKDFIFQAIELSFYKE